MQIQETDGPLDVSLDLVDSHLYRIYRELVAFPSVDEFLALRTNIAQMELTGEHLKSGKYPIYGGLKFLTISLAFLMEAERAYRDGSDDGAWRKLSQAQFFAGISYMFTEMPTMSNKFRQTPAQRLDKDQELKNECARYFQGVSTKHSMHERLRRTRDHLIQFASDFNANLKSGRPLREISAKEAGINTVKTWLGLESEIERP